MEGSEMTIHQRMCKILALLRESEDFLRKMDDHMAAEEVYVLGLKIGDVIRPIK